MIRVGVRECALAFALALVLAGAVASCADEEGASRLGHEPAVSEDDVDQITGALTPETLRRMGHSEEGDMAAALGAAGGPCVAARIPAELAAREVLIDRPDLGGPGAPRPRPVFGKLVMNHRGKPAGHVIVFAAGPVTEEDMRAGINAGFKVREEGIRDRVPALIERGERMMAQAGAFHTVVLGATPTSRRFVKSYPGVPRFLAAIPVAHKRAALLFGVRPEAVRVVEPRFDERSGPGDGSSLVLENAETGDRVSFGLSPDGFLEGELRPLAEAEQAAAERYADRPIPDMVQRRQAQNWAAHVHRAGLDGNGEDPWCVACDDIAPWFEPEGDGPLFDHANAIAAAAPDSLYPSGDDGSESEPCSECSDYVAECWLNSVMGDALMPAPEGTCTGFTYLWASTAFISGVPIFKQWDDHFYTAFLDDGWAAVGCGPIAGVTLLAWHDGLGFGNLVTGQIHSTGQSDNYGSWRGVAVRLNELMGTFEAGDAGATTSGNFEDGLEEYLENRGYSGGLYEVDSTSDIETEVVEARPLVMLYASSGWAQDHYAVIQGFYDDPDDDDFYIHVNLGWGGLSGSMESGHDVVGGIVRYHWDELYDGVQDAKIWRFRVRSDTREWSAENASCGAFTPCDDLDLGTDCVDYATMPPHRSSDPVTTRPPNLPDAKCSEERELFDGTDCVVKVWGRCIDDTGHTYTCTEGDPYYGADVLETCAAGG